jgi:hypothetical protein
VWLDRLLDESLEDKTFGSGIGRWDLFLGVM